MKVKKIILLVISLILIVLPLISCRKDNTEEIEETRRVFDDLPAIEMVDSRDNPLLWDFLNSSLGYKTNHDFTNYGFYYAILFNENVPNKIYIQYYTYGDVVYFPIWGTEIEEYNLTEQESQEFLNWARKVSRNRVIKEDGWTLLIISEFKLNDYSDFDACDINYYWAGINLREAISFESGRFKVEVLDAGLGWPTEWLRQEPFLTKLKTKGFTMDLDFWDRYRAYEILNFENSEGETLEVKVIHYQEFQFVTFQGGTVTINEERFQQYIEVEGWNRV